MLWNRSTIKHCPIEILQGWALGLASKMFMPHWSTYVQCPVLSSDFSFLLIQTSGMMVMAQVDWFHATNLEVLVSFWVPGSQDLFPNTHHWTVAYWEWTNEWELSLFSSLLSIILVKNFRLWRVRRNSVNEKSKEKMTDYYRLLCCNSLQYNKW